MKCHQCQRDDVFADGIIIITMQTPDGHGATALLCSRDCLVDYTAQLMAMTSKELDQWNPNS
jgi:hypothetical protein